MSTHIAQGAKILLRRCGSSTYRTAPQVIRLRLKDPILLNNQWRYNHSQKQDQKGVSQWRKIVTGFVPIGLCLIAVMQWRAFRKSDGGIASDIEIGCYRMLPLNAFSRCFGFLAELTVPVFFRPYLYGTYVSFFRVDLSEAANEDLKSYVSLSEFFVRKLKPGVRRIDEGSEIVAPCDGTVLSVCQTNSDKIEQVKGITYSMNSFLGENIWNKNGAPNCPQQDNTIFQVVIYLAPGNYHRFHSPTDWKPSHRRHFTGELLSVNPFVAKRLPGLFCVNERAVYIGEWKHGFFSYAAVGATNVGSIRVYFDKCLRTNVRREKPCVDLSFKDIALRKGEMIGEFRMGSTVVLLFEAPTNFFFSVKPGDTVRLGQSLGVCGQSKYVDAITNERKGTRGTR